MIVAIDLAILAESIPRTWSFILSSLACVWGLGNTITGLIGESPGQWSATDAYDYQQHGRCWSISVAKLVRHLQLAPNLPTWDGDTYTLFLAVSAF